MNYSKLAEGDKVTGFRLKDQSGKERSLSEFKQKYVVLYFYPKDDTTGCTLESKEFSSLSKEFEKAGAVVLGISPDSFESHSKFCSKHGLEIVLLSDPEHVVANEFGVWGKKKFMGKEYYGINRTTYVLNPEGKILKVWENVEPKGHAKDVFEYLKSVAQVI